MDEGEDARAAAERELLEETGFSGEVTHVSPIVPCDPGITDTNMRQVLTAESNQSHFHSSIIQPASSTHFIHVWTSVRNVIELVFF